MKSVNWLMTSSLPTVVGVALTDHTVANGPDTASFKQHHLLEPVFTVELQPLQDEGKCLGNITPLVTPDGTAGPVDQNQCRGVTWVHPSEQTGAAGAAIRWFEHGRGAG